MLGVGQVFNLSLRDRLETYPTVENLHASGRNCRVKHACRKTATVLPNCLFNESGKLPVILKIHTT